MKKLLALSAIFVSLTALSQNAVTEGDPRADKNLNTPIPAAATVIVRQQMGSGTPGFTGLEPATHVGEGIYHAPQYMAAYPTAGVLWARVIDVECAKQADVFICDGYNWSPALGRGEYLFIRPTAKAPAAVVEKVVPVMVPGPVREVYIEVPVKKKKE
jgi:hypothetical protein